MDLKSNDTYPRKRQRGEDTDTEERPCEGGGRDWGDTITGCHQELEKAGKAPPSGAFGWGMTLRMPRFLTSGHNCM